jgi:hypothetical protein
VVEISVLKNSQLRGMSESEILGEVLKFLGKTPIPLNPEEHFQTPVKPDEIVVIRRKIDTGMGEKNPVRKVYIFIVFDTRY